MMQVGEDMEQRGDESRLSVDLQDDALVIYTF